MNVSASSHNTSGVPPRPWRFCSRALGCKVNQVECEQVVAGLLGRGFEAADEGAADIVVVHTCTVTGEADSKARKAIRHALARPRRPVVFVTGCLAAVGPGDIAALGARVFVEPDVTKVAERIAELTGGSPAAPFESANTGDAHIRVGEGFRTRAMVKVQDGCDTFCTYCIVPYARGAPRSVSLLDVVNECRALVESGVKEIVLTGVNLGRYEHSGVRLPGLVRHVAETGVPRLRLSSVEPVDLREPLLEVLASTSAACEHLHVPLQSGSDAVLRAMGRTCTSTEYADRIASARSALPGLALSTDVMAGFPGESDEQADDTLRFCRGIGFARLHVFRYSPRQGTPAAAREDQIDPRVRATRAARLRALDAELRVAHARSALGDVRDVLVERVCHLREEDRSDAEQEGRKAETGAFLAEGVTRDYFRVRVPLEPGSKEASCGSLVRVRLGGTDGDGVICGVIEEVEIRERSCEVFAPLE